ncbi:MAG TPA: hypothetical protein VMZ24_06710 [Patescibacteria group bacterium]|nr:hypothetical protein [Patescibacteria group bacterium]
MTSFANFRDNCKMRYDFGDQIQVRYRHVDGEEYDTWVSGDEVLQRLSSEASEEKLRRLRKLDLQEIRSTKENLPEEGKEELEDAIVKRLANEVEDFIGGNVIGDSLADAVRGGGGKTADSDAQQTRWVTLLKGEIFRGKVLELAWIQLEGSFPENDIPSEPDDWI